MSEGISICAESDPVGLVMAEQVDEVVRHPVALVSPRITQVEPALQPWREDRCVVSW